jgi:ABC-type glycerol-3-phosphate transport system permease component
MRNGIEFSIRLIAFAITFYLLLEYIAACKVNTWLGLACAVLIIIIVLILFFTFKRHIVKFCDECKQVVK